MQGRKCESNDTFNQKKNNKIKSFQNCDDGLLDSEVGSMHPIFYFFRKRCKSNEVLKDKPKYLDGIPNLSKKNKNKDKPPSPNENLSNSRLGIQRALSRTSAHGI